MKTSRGWSGSKAIEETPQAPCIGMGGHRALTSRCFDCVWQPQVAWLRMLEVSASTFAIPCLQCLTTALRRALSRARTEPVTQSRPNRPLVQPYPRGWIALLLLWWQKGALGLTESDLSTC